MKKYSFIFLAIFFMFSYFTPVKAQSCFDGASGTECIGKLDPQKNLNKKCIKSGTSTICLPILGNENSESLTKFDAGSSVPPKTQIVAQKTDQILSLMKAEIDKLDSFALRIDNLYKNASTTADKTLQTDKLIIFKTNIVSIRKGYDDLSANFQLLLKSKNLKISFGSINAKLIKPEMAKIKAAKKSLIEAVSEAKIQLMPTQILPENISATSTNKK